MTIEVDVVLDSICCNYSAPEYVWHYSDGNMIYK